MAGERHGAPPSQEEIAEATRAVIATRITGRERDALVAFIGPGHKPGHGDLTPNPIGAKIRAVGLVSWGKARAAARVRGPRELCPRTLAPRPLSWRLWGWG